VPMGPSGGQFAAFFDMTGIFLVAGISRSNSGGSSLAQATAAATGRKITNTSRSFS
jgi:hypothetical protein